MPLLAKNRVFPTNLELIYRSFHANSHDVLAYAAENVMNNGNGVFAFPNLRVERQIDPFVEIHLTAAIQADSVAAEIELAEKQSSPCYHELGFRGAEGVLAGFFNAQQFEHGNDGWEMVDVRFFQLESAFPSQRVYIIAVSAQND